MNATLRRGTAVVLVVVTATAAVLASRRRRVAAGVRASESRVTAGTTRPGTSPDHPDDLADLRVPVRR